MIKFYSIFLFLVFTQCKVFASLSFTSEEIRDKLYERIDEYRFSFEFYNDSDVPVKIINIISSCDCVKIESDKKTYQPNEEGKINGVFDIGDRTGYQKKEFIVITDENNCTAMLREYVRRVTTDAPNARIEAFMSVPCGASAQDKQKFYNVAYSSNISKLWLVPAPIAALLGCGIGFNDFEYCALADIGSGCTDIAILGQNGIVEGFTINIGSINIDLAIVSHIQAKYGIKITLASALSLKEQIGSLIPSGSKTLAVSGTETRSGNKKTINATGFDILDGLREYYQVIADSVSSLLAASEAEVCAKTKAQGVIFCGNGSKIEGLKEYMESRLNMPVFIANGARTVYGMQKLSQDKNLIKKLL